ncbi:MAG: hypothetical protein EXR00_07535 [Alphaproteobacteria bacterium]|nr:hypothetical protein [Alphaproteobacteria bacterium]
MVLALPRSLADDVENAMKTRILVPALLLAAMFATPAPANWFSNPYQRHFIGSAPNPRPEDLRQERFPTLLQAAVDITIPKVAVLRPTPAFWAKRLDGQTKPQIVAQAR